MTIKRQCWNNYNERLVYVHTFHLISIFTCIKQEFSCFMGNYSWKQIKFCNTRTSLEYHYVIVIHSNFIKATCFCLVCASDSYSVSWCVTGNWVVVVASIVMPKCGRSVTSLYCITLLSIIFFCFQAKTNKYNLRMGPKFSVKKEKGSSTFEKITLTCFVIPNTILCTNTNQFSERT